MAAIIKDNVMIRQKLLLLILSGLFISFQCWCQDENNITPIKINDIVGDTIDKSEKLRYGLFTDVNSTFYSYAYCFEDHGEIKLRVFNTDSSYADYDYSAEKMMYDDIKILDNQSNTYVEPKSDYKRIIVKLADNYSNKTIKLRKGKHVELKLANGDKPIYVKITDIQYTGESTLYLKQKYKWKTTHIVPLSQVDYINRLPKGAIALKRLNSVLWYTAATAAMIQNPKENYPVAIVHVAIGTGFTLWRNHHFIIDKAEVEIIYK